MTLRTVAIGLKIPDNTAYTALLALRRLGIPVEGIERREIWQLEDADESQTLAARVEANVAVFNPNKHRLDLLDANEPGDGETWVLPNGRHDELLEHLGGTRIEGVTQARRAVGWRLRGAGGEPVTREVLVRAAEGLLCNPAIETARYPASKEER